MIPKKCSLCKGALHEGKAEFLVRVHNEVIASRGCPAYVCDRCGEAYLAETSRKIDAIMDGVHRGTICCRPLAAGEITLAK